MQGATAASGGDDGRTPAGVACCHTEAGTQAQQEHYRTCCLALHEVMGADANRPWVPPPAAHGATSGGPGTERQPPNTRQGTAHFQVLEPCLLCAMANIAGKFNISQLQQRTEEPTATFDQLCAWWGELGEPLAKKARDDVSPGSEYDLCVADVRPENALHEVKVYLTSHEAVMDPDTEHWTHIEYYFAVHVFGIRKYRFSGRYSKLLSVHNQMQSAGCLDSVSRPPLASSGVSAQQPAAGGGIATAQEAMVDRPCGFPRKAGLMEALSLSLSTKAQVQEAMVTTAHKRG